jgi:hypothetical protein
MQNLCRVSLGRTTPKTSGLCFSTTGKQFQLSINKIQNKTLPGLKSRPISEAETVPGRSKAEAVDGGGRVFWGVLSGSASVL